MKFAKPSKGLAGLLLVTAVWTATAAHADVCIWRDPERTMVKLFPEARDYQTITRTLDANTVARVEELAGMSLDETEKQEFNFYAIRGPAGVAGWVLALAGRGEYGVLETVIGLDLDHSIRGIYLQRVRERARAALQSDRFLGQFKGKTLRDALEITPAPESVVASREIARVVKKMLAFDAVLNTQSARSREDRRP